FNLSRCFSQETGCDFQQGGFAGAVRPDQAGDGIFFNRERQIMQGHCSSETLAQPPAFNHIHALSSLFRFRAAVIMVINSDSEISKSSASLTSSRKRARPCSRLFRRMISPASGETNMPRPLF